MWRWESIRKNLNVSLKYSGGGGAAVKNGYKSALHGKGETYMDVGDEGIDAGDLEPGLFGEREAMN